MTRRNFFSAAGAGVMSTAFLSFLESCSKDPVSLVDFALDLDTPAYSRLKTAGNYVYKGNVIVAHTDSDEYVALSKICTHQGCTITFDGSSQFPCPCHGSIFNAAGSAVHGPATSSVHKYTTELTANLLKVTG